jgi:hypothetical protein
MDRQIDTAGKSREETGKDRCLGTYKKPVNSCIFIQKLWLSGLHAVTRNRRLLPDSRKRMGIDMSSLGLLKKYGSKIVVLKLVLYFIRKIEFCQGGALPHEKCYRK